MYSLSLSSKIINSLSFKAQIFPRLVGNLEHVIFGLDLTVIECNMSYHLLHQHNYRLSTQSLKSFYNVSYGNIIY